MTYLGQAPASYSEIASAQSERLTSELSRSHGGESKFSKILDRYTAYIAIGAFAIVGILFIKNASEKWTS